MDGELSDETGKAVSESARAVCAWKSQWAIRQFQFIGGAPVTTYRELRRLANLNRTDFSTYLNMQEKPCLIEIHQQHVGDLVGAPLPYYRLSTTEIIQRIIDTHEVTAKDEQTTATLRACDEGDWAGYLDGQGGAFVARDCLAIRNTYTVNDLGGRYGDKTTKLNGVLIVQTDETIETRTRTFEIRRKGATKSEVEADALALKKGGNAAPCISSWCNGYPPTKAQSKVSPTFMNCTNCGFSHVFAVFDDLQRSC